ncbi:MAG TPA: ComEC/Rec2 family competence protein [candidate division WOR-3 bacterium]|uniref:ComEC/Rec2 family competence protein n=1 Tax=candidate division WOR-3 bacterium TaxID=2052148 RepID=A0A7V5HMZ9_UNCW3|nr:ComEC/Rec2 family competence protein [candidate division WOR-3 bacterium]
MRLYREPLFFAGFLFALGILLRVFDSIYITLCLFLLIPIVVLLKRHEFFILLGFLVAGYLRGIRILKLNQFKAEINGKYIQGRFKIKNNNKFFLDKLPVPFTIRGAQGAEYGEIVIIKGRVKVWKGMLFINPKKIQPVNSSKNLFEKLHNKINRKLLEEFGMGETYYLARSLVLGDRDMLPERIKNSFRNSGIAHLLAISGLHAGMIFIIINLLLTFFPITHKWRYIITISILSLYTGIIGLQAPMTRAFIFTLFATLPLYIMRRITPLNALGVALLISSLFKPEWLTSPGFLLSYLATFGIIYVLPKIKLKTCIAKYTVYPFLASVVAQVFTIPVSSSFFGNISILSPISNIIFLPLTFIFLSETLLAILFSFLKFPLLSSRFSACAHFIAQLITKLTTKISSIPSASVSFHPKIFIIFIYYLIITLVILIMEIRKR